MLAASSRNAARAAVQAIGAFMAPRTQIQAHGSVTEPAGDKKKVDDMKKDHAIRWEELVDFAQGSHIIQSHGAVGGQEAKCWHL